MSEAKTFGIPERVREGSCSSIRSLADWRDQWTRAWADPDEFWLDQARALVHWRATPTRGLEGSFHDVGQERLRWFSDGTLNVTESCLDRHLDSQPDKTAILWEGDEPGETRSLSYRELTALVCRAANGLIELGVRPGDRVIIYMGMVPQAAVAMLACARIGAVHSVVFGGFSADALRTRIIDCGAAVVVTQDEGRRGGRTIPLKQIADEACAGLDGVRSLLVYRRTGAEVGWVEGRDRWWHDVVDGQDSECPAVERKAEDPLFILYTSGSTGKPKGLLHTSGGYLTFAAYTHRLVFDLRPDDIYACVADIGWVTGHTYIVYGPLANGATTFMFESTPTYPDPGRYWDMVERHKINIFYTAPTAIRALAAHGSEPVARYDRSSLRVLGTVGEPINPDAWEWYYNVVGDGRCTIVDTWWQTETGGICLSPIASATPPKPGSATLPLPGIVPVIFQEDGRELRGPGEGELCFRFSWPGQARTIWGDHDRYVETYFSQRPGFYFAGDGCSRDRDGYLWITGRVDDVINVSGHRLGTAEFEAALIHDPDVAESGIVGFPHDIKGQGVYAYIVLQPGAKSSPDLEARLQSLVRASIGSFAKIDRFQYVPGLPKTRSGKVMRRILRRVAEGRAGELGDVSTLADATVVQAIIDGATAGAK